MVRFADLQKKGVKKSAELYSQDVEQTVATVTTVLDTDGWYQRACRFLEHSFRQIQNQEQLTISQGQSLAQEIVDAHLKKRLPQELLIHALHKEEGKSFLITNCVNVTVYAVLLGASLGLPRERLLELGLAALLHDVGKILVPKEILYKESELTEEELVVLRRYPYESFKILRTLSEDYHYLAEVALQVNERLDGSGYPQGLQLNEINPYAQIIGLVDMFESMTHDRPQRQKSFHLHAMKEIIETQKQGFYRELLKALLRTFSIFPLHSYVKLNSGAIGKVIQTYEEYPLRPKIEIVMDAQKRRVLVPRVIDLRDQPILQAVDTVAEERLSS